METWSIPAVLVVAVLLMRLVMVLGRGVSQYRGYFVLLSGNLAFAGWVLSANRFARESGGPSVELVLASLGALLLVVMPELLERQARRAFVDERVDRAARLLALRELLVPGAASASERELFEQMAAARAGRVDEAVRSLRERLVQAEPPEDEAIKERIVTLLVFARRFREAIAQYERHLAADPARYPGLAIQMVLAYGEEGDLEKAAEVVLRLEERLNPQEPTSQAVLLQARLQLLSVAGADRAVERILALDGLARMPARMRESLRTSAREHAGRATAALDGPTAENLARFLEGVAERAARDVRAAPVSAPRATPPVTLALVLANLAAFAVVKTLLGDPLDPDHLVRAGASLHLAVLAGERWRLFTAMFLHANGLHLFFNVYALYLLGRIVEPLVGSPRLLVIYFAAGLGGNLASVYNPSTRAAFSLGASGAVLGILAALMVTLALRRDAWPESWRRTQLLNLGLLVAIQLGVGYLLSVVDNFGHVGGLLCGAAVALLLVPGGLLRRGRAAQALVALSLAGLVAVAVSSLWSLGHESTAATLARLPRDRLARSSVSVLLPAGSTHERIEALGEDALADDLADLKVLPALFGGVQGAAGAVQAAEAHDMEQITGEHPLGVTIEDAAAPKVDGWVSAAKSLPSEQLLYLYYARLAGPDPTRAIVVRMLHVGLPHRGTVVDTEIRSVLASVEVEREGAATASGAPR